MSIFPYKQIHLVGIKGVAMTALAQLLVDAKIKITGSDLPEDFVTKPMLDRLTVPIQTSFLDDIPKETECVVYTAAHQAAHNPQVQQAQNMHIPTLSHAEALAVFFNSKIGVAVCGVGGKSTTTAMIALILEKLQQQPSYAVGVGKILGLEQTGRYVPEGKVFVAEADEYVTDPTEKNPAKRVARFSYLHPNITVCTNILHDHPDVYADEEATQSVFNKFFSHMKKPSTLILNSESLPKLTAKIDNLLTYGLLPTDTFRLLPEFVVEAKRTKGTLIFQGKSFKIVLSVPGFFNLLNAAAALAATVTLGLPLEECLKALESFASTQRRFENKGVVAQVQYYDDYAHHPSEIAATITAALAWEPNKRIVFAFQPHTYSRTKKLQKEFVAALAFADEVLLLPIYASAREGSDFTISSQMLIEDLKKTKNFKTIAVIPTVVALAEWCKTQLQPGDVFLTFGAGDIYLMHDLLQ